MGYDPNLTCVKCRRKPKFISYCEECGGTICNDCLVREKTDCTYCKDCSYISIGSKCDKCGKINYLPVLRKIDRCPICASTKLKDMTKKMSGLPTEFYEAVEVIGQGLISIQKFANKFSEVATNTKQIRRERYGLYPSIETNLMQIQKLFYETKQRAGEILDKVFEYIYQEARTLTFNSSLSIYQLTRIDKAIKMIITHATSYSNLIDDFLEKPKNELIDIEEKIAELKNYSNIFDEVFDKFEPEAYELKIAAFSHVKLIFPGDRRQKVGILFITNKKLYFLPQYKFVMQFKGKGRIIELSMIKDLELKHKKVFGSKMILNLSRKERIRIRTNDAALERLKIIFSNLFNDTDGFVVSDPYLMEGFSTNLNYNNLQEKIDRKINDLKQAPFIKGHSSPVSDFIAPNPRLKPLPREPEEIKIIRIELKAAQDTFKELIKDFHNLSITPDVYYARREKIKQKILTLEEELKEAQKAHLGRTELNEWLDYYSSNSREEFSMR